MPGKMNLRLDEEKYTCQNTLQVPQSEPERPLLAQRCAYTTATEAEAKEWEAAARSCSRGGTSPALRGRWESPWKRFYSAEDESVAATQGSEK